MQSSDERLSVAAQCADYIRASALTFQRETGAPIDVVLAGAHGQIVAMMILALGGPAVAQELRRIADLVEASEAPTDTGLAFASPAGTA